MIDRLPPTEQDVWLACALADIAAHSEQRRRLDRLWNSPISLGDSVRFRLFVLVDAQPDCRVSAVHPSELLLHKRRGRAGRTDVDEEDDDDGEDQYHTAVPVRVMEHVVSLD